MYPPKCSHIILQRQRIVGPKAEGSLFQIPCRVIQTVAGFGDPLSSEFSEVSLLWLVLLFSRFLLSFLVLGLFFCVHCLYALGVPPFFLRFLIQAFVYQKINKNCSSLSQEISLTMPHLCTQSILMFKEAIPSIIFLVIWSYI